MSALVKVPTTGAAGVYLARLSEGSRRAMLGALESIARDFGGDAETFPWHSLRYEHTTAIRARLLAHVDAGELAPATANKRLCALRGVLTEAWRMGHMTAEEHKRASDVDEIKGERLPAGRALDAGELRALAKSCDLATVRGARDGAVLALLYAGGLRRGEVVALDVDAYDARTGALRVIGKGNKERLVYLTNGAKTAVDAWLGIRGVDAGPLLLPTIKGGALAWRRMTEQAILVLLRDLATKAGVAEFSPHDLRRTHISDLLDAGADIATVQKLAGHANVATTARYDRRGEATKAKAAGLLHMSF